jgi:2-dehydro-3-deoxyphosphogluconate aldolase/(4S)-4-hydroxy-2-oxoglutarate aldolase
MTFIDSLRSSRLLGILRGVEATELAMVAEACIKAGLSFIEVTLNTREALSKLSFLRELAEGQLEVGAGTVLSAAQARMAVDAGARFIVSPALVIEVAEAARDLGVPYLPGALTPKEVWDACQASATMVKLFPIQCFGAAYIKELRGPYGDVPLLACGGIRAENLKEYLEAGADAVAIGANTFRREWLASGNTAALTEALSALVDTAKAFNNRRPSGFLG